MSSIKKGSGPSISTHIFNRLHYRDRSSWSTNCLQPFLAITSQLCTVQTALLVVHFKLWNSIWGKPTAELQGSFKFPLRQNAPIRKTLNLNRKSTHKLSKIILRILHLLQTQCWTNAFEHSKFVGNPLHCMEKKPHTFRNVQLKKEGDHKVLKCL